MGVGNRSPSTRVVVVVIALPSSPVLLGYRSITESWDGDRKRGLTWAPTPPGLVVVVVIIVVVVVVVVVVIVIVVVFGSTLLSSPFASPREHRAHVIGRSPSELLKITLEK
jgi:hypothetical protein